MATSPLTQTARRVIRQPTGREVALHHELVHAMGEEGDERASHQTGPETVGLAQAKREVEGAELAGRLFQRAGHGRSPSRGIKRRMIREPGGILDKRYSSGVVLLIVKWISARDLKQWAGTVDARYRLSELVSALIRATATEITKFRFPSGDSAELPGYDGQLIAESRPPFVPGGASVWEFGTTPSPRQKADEDFAKRSKNPGVIVPAETTFVFVTPHEWAEKEAWENEQREKRLWRDVRVIDGVDIEAWLDTTPAVAADFAQRRLGRKPEGAMSADYFWRDFSGRTEPPLTERILLAGRDGEAKRLRETLAQSVPQSILILGDSREEALAFVIATMRSSEEEVSKFLDARTVMVNDSDAALQISSRGRLIICVRSPDIARSSQLVREGNFVVVPLGKDSPTQPRDLIRLSRPSRYDFAEALETMGLDRPKAETLARECGSSVTVLQRLRPGLRRMEPEWCRSETARELMIPALLAGSWDSASQADKGAVERLAGQSYGDFERRLQQYLLHIQDAPLEKVGTLWTLIAPVDSFELLARYIAEKDLENLRLIASEVFAEIDPSLALPLEERPYAALHGKVLKHSSWLRDGLAGTLLLVAVRGEHARLATGASSQAFVNRLITDLPDLRSDHRLIASLRDQLSLLMEAAPDPFVSALEHLLEGEGGAMVGIFSESGALGPSSPHTGLLWALEMLAWDPAYLSQVAIILAKLARIDPGGQLLNRPINSLRTIFLNWNPGTNASLALRRRVLEILVRSEPSVAWNLLLRIFPKLHDVSTPTHRPLWRDAGASEREPLTTSIVKEGYENAVRNALQVVGNDPDRWSAIIKALPTLPPDDRSRIYELLENFSHATTQAQDRLMVWTALRDAICHHTQFSSADWALQASDLDRLTRLQQLLTPADLVQRSAWLFDAYFPDFPDPETERSFEDIEDLRKAALEEVSSAYGAEGVLRLAQTVKFPELVGRSAASFFTENESMDALLESSRDRGDKLATFAISLSGQAARLRGRNWRDHFIERARECQWSEELIAAGLLGWPDEASTWDDAASFGKEVERLYWLHKTVWPLDASPEEIERAAREYTEVGRAAEALSSLYRNVEKLPTDLLLSMLDSSLAELNRAAETGRRVPVDWLKDVFEVLSTRTDVPRLEVARREYMWLPILEYRGNPRTLHLLLAEDPAFFVDILCDVYKPHSQKDQEEATEEHQARVAQGYSLLASWKTLPGWRNDRTVDLETLRAWVTAVRTLAAERDRGITGDLHIGKLLAYAPNDLEDGAWPARGIRDLLEEVAAPDIERGIQNEQFGKRGVYSKALYEGGAQERALAEQARAWAKIAGIWPRTAKLLNNIAASWERQAVREDEGAEQERLRFS